MKVIIRFIFFCWIWFVPMAGIAQLKHALRFEKEMKNNDQEFLVVSMKEEGLALFREKERGSGGNRLWEIVFLDTALQEQWVPELEIGNRLNLIGHDFNNRNIYYLFRIGESNSDELTLYKIDPINREVEQHIIKQELDFRLTHFSVMGNHALLGGYINKQPLVTIYDLKEKSSKIVPGFFLTNAELLDLRPNLNNTFNTLLIERDTKENRKLVLKTFDAAGTLLLDDEVIIDRNRYILSAITSTLERDEMIILGTWSISNSVRQATGIFAVIVDPFTQQSPQYFDFAQFNHFLDYLKPKRASIIKQNSMSRRLAGKIPEFKTYVNPIRVSETSKGFVLLSEVYSPSSANNGFRNNNFYNPYSFNNPFFTPYGYNSYYNRYSNPFYTGPANNSPDESRVLHTSVIEFDPSGKILGDYGLKTNELKLEAIDQASDFHIDDETATLVFKKEKYVRQGVFDKKGELLKSDTVFTKFAAPTESVRHESNTGGVRFWYDDNFYVWGYHTVTDIAKKGEDRNRYVFYIDKLTKR